MNMCMCFWIFDPTVLDAVTAFFNLEFPFFKAYIFLLHLSSDSSENLHVFFLLYGELRMLLNSGFHIFVIALETYLLVQPTSCFMEDRTVGCSHVG